MAELVSYVARGEQLVVRLDVVVVVGEGLQGGWVVRVLYAPGSYGR